MQCAREGKTAALSSTVITSCIPISATSVEGKGSQTWLNKAVTARFSFKQLRDEPGLLARLFDV
eukprot:1204107-Rhodomonas_salina.1